MGRRMLIYHGLLLERYNQKNDELPYLLPAMNGTSEALLLEAIESMVEYFRDDEELLRQELLCFKVLLRRARRLPEVEIERVLRRIRMYDPLLEEDPWVQEYGEKRKAEGRVEGEANGMRRSIEGIIHMRFPDLKDLAMERVDRIQDVAVLEQVFTFLLTAPNERNALHYLETF